MFHTGQRIGRPVASPPGFEGCVRRPARFKPYEDAVSRRRTTAHEAPGIALGNIVGSNILNVLVVIGIAALIAPIAIAADHIRLDTVIVCALTAAFVGLCAFLQLTPVIGALLLVALTAYLVYAVRREAGSEPDVAGVTGPGTSGPAADSQADALRAGTSALVWTVGLVCAGLVTLVLGSHLVVSAAVSMAGQIGVSEAIIGLTIVAFGTSLPEIVTAVVAAVRRHADVALGNVLGSCMFNLLAIGGAIAIISPADVPDEIQRFDNVVMLAATLLLLAAVSFARQIGRPVGALFLGSYAAYLAVIWP